ncbi:MAG: ABC transporter permease [Bacteroidota bacterium]|jgi:lipoprotein-releasing system permease protein|nr:ABC transporter permease [Bacteroidota bacterium]
MSFERFIALRYLRKRNLPRFLSFMTAVAIGSVAVGTAALIITFTILDGFERELRRNLIGFSGHVRVGVYRGETVPSEPSVLARLARLDNVEAAGPFFEREAMVITRDDIEGVKVKGFDSLADLSRIRDRMVAGAYVLNPIDGRHSILVGRRLADKLGVGIGDRMLLLGVTDFRNLADAPKVQCTIRGIYETGMAEYLDDVYVFTALETAQRLFAQPGRLGGYDVLCRDIDRVEETVDAIQGALGYPYDPRSVFALFHHLFVWIDLQQQLIPIVVGSLIVISVFNVIATLLLFVIEKTQYIGILLAMGASRRHVRRIFVMQGLAIGVLGAGLGVAVAFAFSLAQQELRFFSLPQDVYFMTTVPIHMSIEVFAGVAAAGIMLAFLSSFIPAWLASRLNPIRSIRFH